MAAALLRLVARRATRARGSCSPTSATTRATTSSRCSPRARSCGSRATTPTSSSGRSSSRRRRRAPRRCCGRSRATRRTRTTRTSAARTSARSSCRCRTTRCGSPTGRAARWARSRGGSTSRGSSTAACGPRRSPRLLYLVEGVPPDRRQGARPLRVTSTVRDLPYQELLVQTNIQATPEFSLHTTGFAIDIAKPRAEAPLRFLLERLQALNAISWVEEPGAFHLTVGPEAKPFMPIYEALVEDRRPLLACSNPVLARSTHAMAHPTGVMLAATVAFSPSSCDDDDDGRAAAGARGRRARARSRRPPHPGDTLELTVENHTRTRLEYGVAYRLERRTDDGWRWVNRDAAFILLLKVVEPGAREREEIRLAGRPRAGPLPDREGVHAPGDRRGDPRRGRVRRSKWSDSSAGSRRSRRGRRSRRSGSCRPRARCRGR